MGHKLTNNNRLHLAHRFPSYNPSDPENAAPPSLYSRTKSMFNLDSFRSSSAASFGSLVEESEEDEDADELERLRRRRRQSEHFSTMEDHFPHLRREQRKF